MFLGHKLNSQILVSQDFEGPLGTGWYNEGSLVGLENSISPYAGSGMLSLGINERLESPSFTLSAGPKYVSFWMNAYNPYSLATFSIELILNQNGNPAFTLGTWNNINPWDFKAINIPSGYTGSNFSIQFHVLNYSSSYSNLRFYLDNIQVTAGDAVGISEQSAVDNYKVSNSAADRKKISILAPEKKDFTVEIVSLEGKIICRHEIFSAIQNEIDLSRCADGIYLIRITDKKNTFTQKIFI